MLPHYLVKPKYSWRCFPDSRPHHNISTSSYQSHPLITGENYCNFSNWNIKRVASCC